MISIHITTKGAQNARKMLQKAVKKGITKALRKALRGGAKIVQTESKQSVEVRSGATRRSLRVRSGKSNLRKGIIRFKMITKSKTDDAFYYNFVELGTKFIKARRTLKKAADRVDRKVRRYVAEEFQANWSK